MTATEAGLARTALLFGLCHEMFSFALGDETYFVLYVILGVFSRGVLTNAGSVSIEIVFMIDIIDCL